MFDVCPGCGIFDEKKEIDPAGPFATCLHCGHKHRFYQLPLFLITGASGTGKTTVCLELPYRMDECVFLEGDIFWHQAFTTSEDGSYLAFRNLCLRAAKNIAQGGRPVVLQGSATPEQYEVCPEGGYFTQTHYLAFICDDQVLIERLRARPTWREASTPAFIDNMLRFNQWFKESPHKTTPPMLLLDTSELSIEACINEVLSWIRKHLQPIGE